MPCGLNATSSMLSLALPPPRILRNPPCPTKYMRPSRYTATRATAASGGTPMTSICSAKVPERNPMSCRVYTTPPTMPYTNTGLMPRSRDAWAHCIIMSMMATLYRAYSTAASHCEYVTTKNGSSRNAVMTKGKTTRYMDTTLSRRFLNCHSVSRVTAATSVAAMDSTFTSDPTAGSPMASDRMMPVQNPSAPTQRALRHKSWTARRYTWGCSCGTSSNMGLVAVDLAAFEDYHQAEQWQEHQRDKVGGHGDRDEVQREVQHGPIGGAQHEVVVAPIGILAGEQALPQHVEPCRPQSQKPAAHEHERQRERVHVDGGHQEAPSQHVGDGGKLHQERPRGPGIVVHAHGAGEVAERKRERLRQEEPEHDLRRLEVQGKEREHAAPDARGIDGQEERITQRRDVRPERPYDVACVHRSLSFPRHVR